MSAVLDVIMGIDEEGPHNSPLMVHGFSVGGYMYGHMLNLLEERAAEHFNSFHKRCKGATN